MKNYPSQPRLSIALSWITVEGRLHPQNSHKVHMFLLEQEVPWAKLHVCQPSDPARIGEVRVRVAINPQFFCRPKYWVKIQKLMALMGIYRHTHDSDGLLICPECGLVSTNDKNVACPTCRNEYPNLPHVIDL
jgi:uncharacterized paraquat-inducible protein A